MSDKIAVPARRAAYIMLDHGLSEAGMQRGIKSIKQPSSGLYYITDVMDYIRGELKKKAA